MNTRRPVGVILHRKPGTTVSRSSTSLVWGWAASTAVLVSLIFAMMTPWNDPDSESQIGAARGKTGSSFRKHRHMMDARKLLINLLYRDTAQSSEPPGWRHRETKKGPQSPGGDGGPGLRGAGGNNRQTGTRR